MDPVAFAADGEAAGPAGEDAPGSGGAGRGGIGSVLYELVRAKGERPTDVRLLVDGGARYLPLARELAASLSCDVYLTPENAVVEYRREPGVAGGELWDAVAVDRATHEPSEWLVVRPPELAAEVPTWFVSTRGRLRQSSGLVSVQIPGGLAFATKDTFRDTAFLATRMKEGTIRVTTIAVTIERGLFAICRFDDPGPGTLLDGADFARLITASLDLIHPEVQVALTWPTDDAECETLDHELMLLADSLNRTVWAPQPQGAAFVLPGCGEFAAVDEVGGPSAWRAYPPRMSTDWRPRLATDLDGRLVPLGDVAWAQFPGLAFVSVPLGQLEYLRPWYESVTPWEGLFTIDLAVLGDGRLGVLLRGGYAIAVAPQEMRAMLREAGWRGEDLLLLTQPPANLWSTTMEHLQSLVDVLAVDVWTPARGAQVWSEQDGRLAANGPEGGWHVVGYGRTEREVNESTLPAGLVLSVHEPGQPAPRPATSVADSINDMTVLIPGAFGNLGGNLGVALGVDDLDGLAPASPALGAPALGSVAPAAASADGSDAAPAAPAAPVEPVEPAPVLGIEGPHRVDWLPDQPATNAHPMDIYIWCPDPVLNPESEGLPSARTYLLAGIDALRLAERHPTGHLLRVRVHAHGCIDLREHASALPASVRAEMSDLGATHLLPLPWFCDAKVTARFDLDGGGGVAARHDIGPGALAIRFTGAGHGIPGLPEEVVRWPERGQRADAPCYLMLPESTPLDRRILQRGFVPLSRRKPALQDGHVLMEVKIRKRRAIDVPATLSTLTGQPVAGSLTDLVGLDLLLAEPDLGQATPTRYWQQGPTGRPVVTRMTTGETLLDALSGSSSAS